MDNLIEWKEEDDILVGYLGKWEVCTYDKDFMDGCLTFSLPPGIFRGQVGPDCVKDKAEEMTKEWIGSSKLMPIPVNKGHDLSEIKKAYFGEFINAEELWPDFLERLLIPTQEHMCCCLCGHITVDHDYETVGVVGDEVFPVCPKCGEHNTGGYSSYAIADVWPEDMIKHIVDLNTE